MTLAKQASTLLQIIQEPKRLSTSLKIRLKRLPIKETIVVVFCLYVFLKLPNLVHEMTSPIYKLLLFLTSLSISLSILLHVLSRPVIALMDRIQATKERNRPLLKPFSKVVNPIITKNMVTDRTKVKGVADPFIVLDKGRYHLFFEIVQGKNPSTGKFGDEIGHAYSDNLIDWHYTQVVLSMEEHGHRSAYPNVFKVDGEWYMIPDTSGHVILYKAIRFPFQWKKVTTLLATPKRLGFVDTNVFKVGDTWYLTTTGGELGYNGVTLYFNSSGDWKNDHWNLHPEGLIIPHSETEGGLRGAGNPLVFEDYILLPIQVTPIKSKIYGEYTKLFKLSNLSPLSVMVTDFGKLTARKKDGGWADKSMHHVSHANYITKKIFAVDGTSSKDEYSIGLYME